MPIVFIVSATNRNKNQPFHNKFQFLLSAASARQLSQIGFADSVVTSRTRISACAECCKFMSDLRRTRPPKQSALGLTVPAVERVAERESWWLTNVQKTDGSFPRIFVSRGAFRIAPSTNSSHVILDYLSASLLDYRDEDYVCAGNVRAPLVIKCYDNKCGFLSMMEVCNDDPRVISKIIRTQGKNISKLKKLFDSCEKDVYRSVDDAKPTSKIGSNETSSGGCDTKNVTDTPIANVVSESLTNSKNVGKCSSAEGSELKKREVNINMEGAQDGNAQSQIPFCRKVTKGSLWENVNIGTKNENCGLWNSNQNYAFGSQHVGNGPDIQDCSEAPLISSAAELHDLVAISRAEMSKGRELPLPDKSNLEHYFTSFENLRTKTIEIHDHVHDDSFSDFPSPYGFDINEINFEEDDALLSDSSEEDLRCHPAALNTNYLPAYSLHTIIEESCEESERDSRATTPTNKATSKLERYFSWDIINESDIRPQQNGDDASTVYSDSLSDRSGSFADNDKDIDTSQLASSRLEKYFTSGLIDEQNYFYPDDAEFLDDTPVSDFEEENVNQKISRSALLSALEVQTSDSHTNSIPDDLYPKLQDQDDSELVPAFVESNCSGIVTDDVPSQNCDPIQSILNDTVNCDTPNSTRLVDTIALQETNSILLPKIETLTLSDSRNLMPSEDPISEHLVCSENSSDTSAKKLEQKESLTIDIQGIIKKLLCYFTDPPTPQSVTSNVESAYISAWELLEKEIELLIQSISSNSVESNSCNSSTIDSNNSDYGSDTVESVECMTDEDDAMEPKSRQNNAKLSLVDILNLSYTDSSSSSFVISDESLSIWKRLVQSLQKDNFLSKDQIYNLNDETRSYIRDQIANILSNISENDASVNNILVPNQTEDDSLNDTTKEDNLTLIENQVLEDQLEYSKSSDQLFTIKPESSDEGISDNSSEDVSPIDKINVNILSSADAECETSQDITMQDCKITPPISPVIVPRQRKSPKTIHTENAEIKFSIVNIDLNDNPDQENIDESQSHNDDTKPYETTLKGENVDSENFAVHSATNGLTGCHSRETGYFSYKSSDDSLLNISATSLEPVDVPDFKSLKRPVKKFPLPNSLISRSTNNIFQNFSFSTSDSKTGASQSKSKKNKTSANDNSSSLQFTSLFSPSAVLKRFTLSRANNGVSNSSPEPPVPAKYMKKYARSISNDSDNLIGAISMPQLNSVQPGDSYSALGLYSEHDHDSSVILDDVDLKPYGSGSQSVLSLGSHSMSMTSVYSSGNCHFGYVTVSGDVLFGLNYNQKSQTMEVFVKQCRNIAAMDIKNNKSNPYVKVYLLPDKTRSGKRKTKVKKNTLSPVFNELLRFPVQKNELESRTMWLSVWNSDLFGRNDFLGEVSLPLGYRLLDSPTLRWYPLQERAESPTSPLLSRGELFLALKYVPRDLSLETRFRPAPVISPRGALHVLVKEARNVANDRGPLDAFCKSYLLPDKCKSSKQKTPVVRRSRHPKWYYTVVYEDVSVDELRERSVELSLWHRGHLGTSELVGAVRLNTGCGLYHGVAVDWMDARRDEASLWNTMLDSPNMWVDGCLPLRPHLQHT